MADVGFEANDTIIVSQDNFQTGLVVEILMYAAAFLFGMPLNVFSMYWLLKSYNAMKHPTSIILLRLHLNLADLITLSIYVPKQIIWLLTYWWYGGDFLCKVCAFFSTFCFYLHAFVIALIALDRLLGARHINSILAARNSYARVKVLLYITWCMAVILAIPQMLIFQSYTIMYRNSTLRQCIAIWQIVKYETSTLIEDPFAPEAVKIEAESEATRMNSWERWYSNTHLFFIYVLPTGVILVCYILVLCILKKFIKREDLASQKKALILVTQQPNSEENSKCDSSRLSATACVVYDANSEIRGSNFNLAPPPSSESIQGDDDSQISHLITNGDTHLREPREGCVTIKENGHKKPKPRHQQRIPVSALTLGKIHQARKEAKRQAAFIIIAFFICWSPYNISAIISACGLDEIFYWDFSFLNSLITINTIVNPLIYLAQQRR